MKLKWFVLLLLSIGQPPLTVGQATEQFAFESEWFVYRLKRFILGTGSIVLPPK